MDKNRISQVITNLVENAVKFSAEGRLIRIGVKASGAQLLFEIEDHGEGMSKEVMANLFKPFLSGGKGSFRQDQGYGAGTGHLQRHYRSARRSDPG